MNKKYEPSKEVSIDLNDMLWKLLFQWKAVLIVCIIGALIIPSVKYLKDRNAYNNAVSEQEKAQKEASIPAEERIESALEALPEGQRRDVLFIVQQQELADHQKDYLDNSILMNIDPARQRQLSYNYLIVKDSDLDVQTFCDAYSTCLKREAVVEELRDVISPDSKLEYIKELISLEDHNRYDKIPLDSGATSTILTITIIVPSETDAEAVTSVVDSAVASAHETLTGDLGEHKLKKINMEDEYKYNTTTAEKRTTITLNVNNLNYNNDNAIAKLSEAQRTALETILKIKRTAASDEGETLQANKEMHVDAEPPSFNAKYSVLGFIIGGIAYAGIYAVMLVLGRRLLSASSVKGITGIRTIGEIYKHKDRKGLAALLTSPALARRRYGNKLDEEKQSENIAGAIASVCMHNGSDRITLVKNGVPDCFEDDIRMIADKCKAANGDLKTLDILDSDSMDEKALNSVKDAVYIVSSETKTDSLGKLMSLFRDYDIRPVGSVYMEEV